MCTCARMCWYLRARRDIRVHGAGVTGDCEPPSRVLERAVSTAEPSHQPLFLSFSLFLFFSHTLHPSHRSFSFHTSQFPTLSFPQIYLSFFSLQKRAGLSRLSTKHSITTYNMSRHRPSRQGWQGNPVGGKGSQDTSSHPRPVLGSLCHLCLQWCQFLKILCNTHFRNFKLLLVLSIIFRCPCFSNS